MVTIRGSNERGSTKNYWLDSKHSFSFGCYQDSNHMGFGPLRVLNEDKVKPGSGFAGHPHRDMEIVSYVLNGKLEHKDSMGTGSIIKPGDIQRMSAGTGVMHSEYNASETEHVHFLQIWFLPEKKGIEPSYQQRSFDQDATRNSFKLVMSFDGREDTMTINQDVDFYIGRLDGSKSVRFKPSHGGIQWVQIARGAVDINNKGLRAGDGGAIRGLETVFFDNATDAEILLFDMKDINHQDSPRI